MPIIPARKAQHDDLVAAQLVAASQMQMSSKESIDDIISFWKRLKAALTFT